MIIVAVPGGDGLVFHYSNIHHVAIYIGAGKVIHAPTYGEDVTIAPIASAPIFGYGRP
jgi:cell wall-associated NlpC family hydrolase